MVQPRNTKARARKKPGEPRLVVAKSLNCEPAIGLLGAEQASPASFEQIQRRAYELFVARGRTHGEDLADWLTAEHELTATSAVAR